MVKEIPIAGRLISGILSMATISVLAFCLTRRIQFVRSWKKLSLIGWLTIWIYIDSFLFIFITAVLSRSWSLNQSSGVCEAAILLCLICYMSTKVLIYYFLVEKAYIIRGSRTPRFRNKLWLFNFFGVICPYIVVIILNFVYRVATINDSGVCIIGMEKMALIPLISFEVVLNIYLTSLFLHPLRQLYSYKNGTNGALRVMAIRTFFGSCATLASSVTNMLVLTILDGEPGWICLMLCNLDVLFSVLVLHWVTSVDRDLDNSSHGTLRSHPVFDLQRNMSRGKAEFSSTERKAGVTTNIEANGNDHYDEIALDAIAVKTSQTQEVEVRGHTSRSDEFNHSDYEVERSGSQDAIVHAENVV